MGEYVSILFVVICVMAKGEILTDECGNKTIESIYLPIFYH